MLKGFGFFVYRRRMIILILGIIVAAGAGLYGSGINDSLKGGGMVNPSAETGRVAELLQSEFGQDKGLLLVTFRSRNNLSVDDPRVKKAVLDTLARIVTLDKFAKLLGVKITGKLTTYYSTGDSRLISKDKLYTLALIGLNGDSEDANVQAVKKLQPLLTHPDLEINLGGKSAVSNDLTNQIKQDLVRAELLTFPLVGLLLIFIFRSVVAAFLPLLVGAATILGAFTLLRLVTIFSEASTFTISIITVLGLGLAIDYSLFMVSRFREELKRTKGDKAQAVAKTMETAGHTVIFSGLTVIVCLLSLLVFPSMFFKSMGFGAALAVLVAVITSLTILPAILSFMGEGVNKGAIRLPFRQRSQYEYGGVWNFIGRQVVGHPVIVLVFTLGPLVWAGSPYLRAEFAMYDVRSLPVQQSSRTVNDVLINRFDYSAFYPLQVVVRTDRSTLDSNNLGELHDFLAGVQNLRGVTKVESLFDLSANLDKAGYTNFFSERNLLNNPVLKQATRLYASDNYYLVKVYFRGEAYSATAKDLVKEIRGLTAPIGFSLEVGGETAFLVDFLNGLVGALPLALGLIAVAMFILLLIMLGSVVIPLKALVLNFLSLSVSFGALVWIFQEGNWAALFNFTPVGTIDGSMPVLLFAISFGLSMDYEVFLLSRIKEEYKRTGNTSKAIVTGLNKTGSIITGAALTLAVVVAALAFTEVAFVKQVGVGLTIAILVDATVVRMLLLPATMQLMGRYNWWSPRFLKKNKREAKEMLSHFN